MWLDWPFFCLCIQKGQKCNTTTHIMKDEFGKYQKHMTLNTWKVLLESFALELKMKIA